MDTTIAIFASRAAIFKRISRALLGLFGSDDGEGEGEGEESGEDDMYDKGMDDVDGSGDGDGDKERVIRSFALIENENMKENRAKKRCI